MEQLELGDLINTFSALNQALNTEFVEEKYIQELNKQITEEFSSIIGEQETTELMKSYSCDISNVTENIENALSVAKLKDADFLDREMKSLIVSSRKVLETLEKDIKVGASPRAYEVYAGIVNAITGQFKELRNLNESVAKLVIENKKQNLEEAKEEHKIILSSNDALDMYMKAKKSSQMETIDADFDIMDT